VTSAIVAARAGDAARVIRVLQPAAMYDHAPAAEFWPSYLRGEAYLALKQPSDAIKAFALVVDHRGEAPTSPLYSLSVLGMARGQVLAGESQAARTSYERLFNLWSAADADLPIMKAARQEYARIR
jgi:hypothetical protein